MKDKINDGGPAFPSHGTMGGVVWEGMTLRDYFAAAVAQGFCATQGWVFSPESPPKRLPTDTIADLSLSAYQIADAMLKARGGA